MRRHRLVAFGALAVAACLSACASLFGFEELTFSPDASTPADAPTAPEPDASTGPTCNPERPAERPSGDSGDDTTRLTFVFNDFDLGVQVGGGAAPVRGYDLDGVCTTKPGEESCTNTQGTIAFDDYTRDKTDRGVDNAAYVLLQFFRSSIIPNAPFKPETVSESLKLGKFGFLLDIEGYNGQPNDPTVKVSFRPTLGLTDGGVPRFDRTDEWMIDDEFATRDTFGASSIFDFRAYVTGGVLYARFDPFSLPIQRKRNGNVLKLALKDVVMSAKVERGDGGGYVLTNGIVAGKWPMDEAFKNTRVVAYQETEDVILCAMPFDQNFRDLACKARDIRVGAGADASAPCDAVSVGFGFTAVEATSTERLGKRFYRDASCPTVTCATPAGEGGIPENQGTFPPQGDE